MGLASALILASALLHALWNAALKREEAPQRAVVRVLAFALLFAAAAAAARGQPIPAGRALWWSLASGLFEGVYFVTLAGALARSSYGVVYAVARGGAMVLVWPATAILLAEPVTARRLLGAGVLGVGLVLVAVAGRLRASPAGLALAVACAGAIAGYHLCYDQALRAGGEPAPVFALSLSIALPLAWLAARTGAGGPLVRPRDLLRWAVAGGLATASFLLFLEGLARSGPGAALTLRNSSVLFAQVIAVAMGEPMPPRQLAGAAMVAAGAALVA